MILLILLKYNSTLFKISFWVLYHMLSRCYKTAVTLKFEVSIILAMGEVCLMYTVPRALSYPL
jgi:hypothetical protein